MTGRSWAAALTVALLAWPGSPARAQELEADTENEPQAFQARTQIEEIVVQARKRAEALEDTPISITVLSETTLRETGVVRLDDIQNLVPNLTITTDADGVAADIQIRGVGNPNEVSVTYDPGVGIYVDGVFLSRAVGSLIDVVDVEQIEVLRGPQGTLFGKNTVGGAVNITTAKPTQEFEGFAYLRPGNFDSVNARAMVNIPVVEDLVATRLSVAYNGSEGYSYNSFRDEYWSNQNSLTFLGSVRITPTDDLSIDVTGTWSRTRTQGRGGQCVNIQETAIGSLDPDLYPACEETGPFLTTSDADQLFDMPSYGTWGTLTYDVGDLGPLTDVVTKVIGSWRRQEPRVRVDGDQTNVYAFARAGVGGGPQDGFPGDQKQWSAEGQFNASAWDDRIHFVTGVFGYWERADENFALSVLPSILNVASLSVRKVDNWTWAAFGQGTIDITDWAAVTAGIRYTQDKKGLFAETIDANNPELPPTQQENNSQVFDAWTPMASLTLAAPEGLLGDAPIDHLMGYLSYARGFRGGGFNGVFTSAIATEFQPETLDSFEVGAKTVAFDQRATFNVSLFYGLYDDIQVSAVRSTDTGGDIEFEQTTLNAANATTKGAEIELVALPIEGLQTNGSVGILYTDYGDFPNGVSDLDTSTIDRSGESFANSPELQTHIAVQYSWATPWQHGPAWLEGWVTPRLDWYYQSSMMLIGPEIRQGTQGGYNLLHARLSYGFNGGRSQVALWGKNLTDETYFNSVIPVASSLGVLTRFYGAPRTWGGELSHRF